MGRGKPPCGGAGEGLLVWGYSIYSYFSIAFFIFPATSIGRSENAMSATRFIHAYDKG